MKLPDINFYLPPSYLSSDLPHNIEENWRGFGLGIYAWTLQTYLRLKAVDFPCHLVDRIPTEGIVIVHHNALRSHGNFLQPGRKLLLICIKAEGRRYPYAQLHIVQNPVEAIADRDRYYIPHWTQPGLIPRAIERGDRFENIAFFGHVANLAPELQEGSWQKQLESMGLCWRSIINRNSWHDFSCLDNRWNDYSCVDAMVAVRKFSPSPGYRDKPATKLYNAWLAGVPAILGCEWGYRAEGKPGVNYLEVSSFTELIAVLERLKRDRDVRRSLVDNGRERGREFLPERTVEKWREFLLEVAVPEFYRWCECPRWQQSLHLARNVVLCNLERGMGKVRSLLGRES
ncbi:MAG: glycosyltransferase [Spirulina sp.]